MFSFSLPEVLRVVRTNQTAAHQFTLEKEPDWVSEMPFVYGRDVGLLQSKNPAGRMADQPPLTANVYANARVTRESRFPAIICRGNLVVTAFTREESLALSDPIRSPGRTGGGGYSLRPGKLIPVGSKMVIRIRDRDRAILERAIYAGAVHPQNWSHWLLNFLPAVFCATRLPPSLASVPLLVPAPFGKSESNAFEDSLAIAWGDRPTTPIVAGETKVSELISIDLPFPHGPFGATAPASAGLQLEIQTMKAFRSHVLGFAARVTKKRRIYLKRAQQTHNVLAPCDESLFEDLLDQHGFTPVELERLPFTRSVAVVHEAHAIVGIDGSAFANLIFANPRAKVLSLMPDTGGKHEIPLELSEDFSSVANRDFYGNLAAVVGFTYRVLVQPTVITSDGRRTVHIDADAIAAVLTRYFGKLKPTV